MADLRTHAVGMQTLLGHLREREGRSFGHDVHVAMALIDARHNPTLT